VRVEEGGIWFEFHPRFAKLLHSLPTQQLNYDMSCRRRRP
jgi:hypothetical protein